MATVGLYPLLDRREALEWAARAIQLADTMQLRSVLPPEASVAMSRPDLALEMASWCQPHSLEEEGLTGTTLATDGNQARLKHRFGRLEDGKILDSHQS